MVYVIERTMEADKLNDKENNFLYTSEPLENFPFRSFHVSAKDHRERHGRNNAESEISIYSIPSSLRESGATRNTRLSLLWRKTTTPL